MRGPGVDNLQRMMAYLLNDVWPLWENGPHKWSEADGKPLQAIVEFLPRAKCWPPLRPPRQAQQRLARVLPRPRVHPRGPSHDLHYLRTSLQILPRDLVSLKWNLR